MPMPTPKPDTTTDLILIRHGETAWNRELRFQGHVNVALNAINKVCKKDRGAILDAVFATKDFDGVLGKWSFDANGDTSLTGMSGVQVKGGKFDTDNTTVLK